MTDAVDATDVVELSIFAVVFINCVGWLARFKLLTARFEQF